MKKVLTLASLLVFGVAMTAWAAGKNLQHFKKDISDDDLNAQMKIIKRSLGVSCKNCHQMEPRDMSVDTDKKKIARDMLDMTDKINKNDFNAQLFGKRRIAAVDCNMCHKGHAKPEMKPASADDEKKFNEMVDSGRKKKAVDGMKQLVENLNKTYFTWKDAPKATCWMCHRGHGGFKNTLPAGDDDDKKTTDEGKKTDDPKKPDDQKKPEDPKKEPE